MRKKTDLETSPSDAGGKPEWRTWAKARRETVSVSEVLERLTALAEWRVARHVLLYLALPGEIVVEKLAINGDKWFYVPRCAPGRHLAIHPLVPGETRLEQGAFGLREPLPGTLTASPETMDLVIVPALCFDIYGHRLGYGGGYYDRFLPRLRTDCVTVGVAGDGLVVSRLPTAPHDKSVQIVVTPGRTFRRADTIAPTPPPCLD